MVKVKEQITNMNPREIVKISIPATIPSTLFKSYSNHTVHVPSTQIIFGKLPKVLKGERHISKCILPRAQIGKTSN